MRSEAARYARLVVLLVLVASLAAPRIARAAPSSREPLVFVADPKLGVETSVRSIDSLGRLAFRYDEALPRIAIDDSTLAGKVARFFGRGLQLLFLDEPIAELTSAVAHEAGGHGARARELGLSPEFTFRLPGIYRRLFSPNDDEPHLAFTSYDVRNASQGQNAVVTLGGLEANYVQAWWINARLVRSDGWTDRTDLLLYGAAKLPYFDSFLSIPPRGSARGGDVTSYVGDLQELSNGWRTADRERIAQRLRIGYLWNLADPTLLYAAYAGVVSYLIRGEPIMRMPLPTWRGRTLLLSPRFALTPFGAEQALDLFVADQSGKLLDVYGRVGTSGLASYWGAGAKLLGARIAKRVTLGGELDVWRQPELLLDERALFDRPNRVGINVGLYGDVRLTNVLSLTGKLAGKTSGYLMGQPLGAGPHGYVGVSLAWQ